MSPVPPFLLLVELSNPFLFLTQAVRAIFSCRAAELIVSPVAVPAVDYLPIPPDKLLPKFKA